jgi:Rrf2 family protein
MKISTKGRYGIRILLDIALNDLGKPRLMRDIAKTQGISEKYISRLAIDLRVGGFINSARGANGGYMLARFPRDIRLLDVVETMEGPVSIVDCVNAPQACDRIATCPVRDIWVRVNDGIRDSFANITLQDVVNRHRNAAAEAGTPDYCI